MTHVLYKKNPNNANLFFNLFCRIEGVEQKQSYQNLLYQTYTNLKQSGRQVVVLDTPLPELAPNEISAIHRSNSQKAEDMILEFSQNLKCSANVRLERLMVKNFIDLMLEVSHSEEMNLNKLNQYGIYLICWIKKFHYALFSNWKMPETACFLYLGGCRNEREVLFFRFLSRLPVDILILTPDLEHQKCMLEDDLLYPVHYSESLAISSYPKDISELRLGTTAYHAERELDTILYQDSGIYRNQQYSKANAVTLQTTFDEIALYWREEVNMRPNFSVLHDTVTIPVIFAKVSGVKDGDISDYWNWAKELMAESPYVIHRAPFVMNNMMNPFRNITTEFLANGKLQRDKITKK